MQGEPLTMVTYSIGIIPVIKWMKMAYLDITQPWYAEDAGALGTYKKIESYFNLLKQFGP